MTTFWLIREREPSEIVAQPVPVPKVNTQISHMKLDAIPPASPILSQRKELANNGRVPMIADSPSEEGIPLLSVTSSQETNNS